MLETRDARWLRDRLVTWIREQVRDAGVRGAIFGLSGGVDSAVVCGLAAEAIGAQRCLGLIMPIDSLPEDERLAGEVAEQFGVPAIVLGLGEAYHPLLSVLRAQQEGAVRAAHGLGDPTRLTAPIVTESAEALARANVKPRLRMISLYYFSNLLGYLVLGTGNRDEFTVGYFTKWGDGAADAFPLGNVVKQEVWELARVIGVPDEVVRRAPTAGLWPGQTDEEELGISYAQIDGFLITGTSGDPGIDREIERRAEASRHKTSPSPVARPG